MKYAGLVKKIVSAAVFGGFICLAIWYFRKHPEIVGLIKTISPSGAALMFLFTILYYFAQGIILKELVSHFGVRISVRECFGILMVTLFGNYFLPYSGLGFRAAYLKKRYNFDYTHFVSTLGATYLLEFLVFTAGGMIALAHAGIGGDRNKMVLLAVFVMIILGCLTVLLFSISIPDFGNSVLKRVKSLVESWYHIRKSKALILRLAALTVLEFLFSAAMFYVAVASFSKSASFVSLFLPTCLSDYSFIFRFTPGSFGVYEGAVIYSLSILGMTVNQGLAAVSILRIFSLSVILVLGPISFYLLNHLLLFGEKQGRIKTEKGKTATPAVSE